MEKSFILDLIYKTILIILLFSSMLFCEEYIETLGNVVTDSAYILEKPHRHSHKLIKLYKGQTVIISGEYKDFYKIKINNYSDGYVLKKYVVLRNALKEDKNSLTLKNLQYMLKDLFKRFNEKLTDSTYYKRKGVIPVVSFSSCNLIDNTLTVDITYICKNSYFIKNKISDKLNSVMKNLIEVIFLNMMSVKADTYYINVYSKIGEKPLAIFEYEPNIGDRREKLKSGNSIWGDIKVNKNKEFVFVKCP